MADINATLDLQASSALAQIDAIERRLSSVSTLAVNLDTGNSARELDDLNDEVEELDDGLGRAEGQADTLGKTLKGAFAAIGIRAAWEGLTQLTDAASDLEESSSKAGVVFGESFSQVERFAKDAATAVGLSEAAALEATGTFGNLFTAQGLGADAAADLSTGVVQLAADLASFNNIEVSEAVEKLRAGLIGEVEPVRTLGINFDAASVEAKAFELGLADANGEVDQGAKLQARYAIFLEQTTAAQGDFARTSDGLANSQRTLQAEFENVQAEIGQYLLPVALELVGVLREELIPAAQDLGPALADIVASGGRAAIDLFLALLPVVEAITPGIEALAGALALIPTPVLALAGAGVGASRSLRSISTAAELADGATGKLRGKLVGAAGLVGALLVVSDVAQQAGDAIGESLGLKRDQVDIDALTNDLVALRDGLDDLANLDTLDFEVDPRFDIDNLGDAINRITDPSPWNRLQDATEAALGPLGEGASRGLRSSTEAVEELDQALVNIARQDGVEAASRALTLLADSQGLTADELERLLPLLDGFQNEVDRYGNEVQQAHKAQEDAEGSTGPLAEGLEDVKDEADDATSAIEDYLSALDRLVGVKLDAGEAAIQFRSSLADLDETIRDTESSADDVESSFIDVARQIIRNAEAQAELTGSLTLTRQQLESQIEDLRSTAREAGLSEAKIDALIATYGLVPEDIITSISVDAEDAIREIERYLGYQARIDPTLGIVVSVPGSVGPGGRTENAASGAYITATPGGRLVRVGEGGADEVIVPTNQPERASLLLERAGLVDVVQPTDVAGVGGRTAPVIGTLSMSGVADPEQATRTVMRTVEDAEFLNGGF